MAAQRPAGQAWFRLPTMRPPATAAAAAPPPVVRPAIPTRPPPPPPPPPPSDQPQVPAAAKSPPPPAARPPSPPRAATPPPPPPPASSSPVTKAAITTTSTSNDDGKRSATPVSSPKIVKPSPHPHPPSPLQLPPASEEPKIDQKSVLVQESVGKQPPLVTNTSSKGKRETPMREKKKKASDSEDLGVRVITIAGENRGALMEISYSSFKKSSKINGKAAKKANDGEDDESQSPLQATATFLNSNVQGVNNSIVYNSSCSHHDPGIHLSLTRNPKLNVKTDGS
ncbi:hypothetical protein C2S51_023908 [Perilla frutescens var. frutescens]|nr:hypothetical protein C2S51_023908 [Perilla frutescens var. frutescens]